MHDRQSHVTPQHRALLGSIEDNKITPELIDSDEADAEEEDDYDDANEDYDDDDAGDDKAHDEVTLEDEQQSMDEGMFTIS